mgnify:CR=1 FL=1|tara:strand:- start:4041 stop:5774 length:1734 start_codon:yes stop_codon:yes gene_type:complete
MSSPIYEIDGVQLDTALREIRVDGVRKDVTPQVFDTLEFLAKNCNRVISKDALIHGLWPGMVVTDASVSQAIRRARRTLKECGLDPNVIRTQHGHGYRLDCDVAIVEGEAAHSDADAPAALNQKLRVGAIVALLGGVLVTAANISEIASWFVPSDTQDALEETQSTLESTNAKVDELVTLLRNSAAMSGLGFDPESERTITRALTTIIESGGRRKAAAINYLIEGDVSTAAEAIEEVARDQSDASHETRKAAATSWREAGALYYSSSIEKAVLSYEAAYDLEPEDVRNVLELAFTYLRAGRMNDAESMFNAALELQPQSERLATALRGLGAVAKLRGDYAAARSYLSRSMLIAEESNVQREIILDLLLFGAVARAQGDNDEALAVFERAYSLSLAADDTYLQAEALNQLGVINAVIDAYSEAKRHLTLALELHRKRQDLAGQANALGNLGASALNNGRADEASGYLKQSIAIGERLGWQRSIALDLINLATIEAANSEFDAATATLNRAFEIVTEIQYDEMQPIILVNLGEVSKDRGDSAAACRYWAEALPVLQARSHAAVSTVEKYLYDNSCPAAR